jgi:TIR domain
MSLNVFLSFSVDPDDQAIIWRLQTLAAAHGIHLYVPLWQAVRHASPGQLPPIVKAEIDGADCVLAIITRRTTAAVKNELNYALSKQKVIVPLVEESVRVPPIFGKHRVFRFVSGEASGDLESKVVEFLKEQQVNKERRQAVGAVVAIGLGLFALSALSQE